MDEELTEEEAAQVRKFAIVQKVAGQIIRKWRWFLLLVFIVLAGGFSAFLVWHTAKSQHRFEATTRLLYTPRQVAKIQNMDEKQLLTVLDRASLKRRVAAKYALSQDERMSLVADLAIVQEKRPSNLYTLTANAPSLVAAVRKVNTYAGVLIDEYVTYRSHDLENWRESLSSRRKSLQDQLADLEGEEGALKGKTGVVSPVETLTMVNSHLSDQRKNLSLISIQIANDELKKKKLEEEVGATGAVVSENAAVIRRKSAELAAIDAEIAKLREEYTDRNSKVLGKLDDRNAMLAAYKDFLKEKGIEGLDIGAIDRIERTASSLADTSLKLEAMYENRRILEQEIAANEKRAGELTSLIPAFERLQVKRTDLEQTMRSVDEQMQNIGFLQMSMRNDLRLIERACGADDSNPFRPKNFAIAFGGALVCVLVLMFWIVAMEFAFGRVRGLAEMTLYDGMVPLGSIPKSGSMPEADERDVLGVVALKMTTADVPKGVVLGCRLPGTPDISKFNDALSWSLAMSGVNPFWLEVVPGKDFAPPEGAESMINTVSKGDHGWFPVENRFTIAPTELQMLQADIASLREKYDHVFIRMPGGVRRGGSFFDQLLTVCDSVLLAVGAGKTPRSWYAYARKHIRGAGRTAMVVAAGVSPKVVRREMEDSK